MNFSEDCPKNILLPYLPDIMGRLEEVLKAKFNELVASGNKLVLEQIVTTIMPVWLILPRRSSSGTRLCPSSST